MGWGPCLTARAETSRLRPRERYSLPTRIIRNVGCLSGCVAFIVGVIPLSASAKAHFHLKNCGTYSVDYQTFNGNDSALLIPYEEGRVAARKAGTADASTHRMYCGSDNYCKILLIAHGFDSHPKKIIRIRKDNFLRIVYIGKQTRKYEYLPGIQRSKTSSVLTYRISAQDEACTDPAPGAIIIQHK